MHPGRGAPTPGAPALAEPFLPSEFVSCLLCFLSNVLCCIGTWQVPGMGSCVLWLTFFVFLITPVTSVCNVCFGDAQGCSGASDQCPWKIGMAANVAAITGAVALVIKLDNLLPPRYLRVFTRPVLQTLGIISSKPKGGASFDMTGKSGKDIYEATVGGHVPKDEAVIELTSRIEDEEAKATPGDRVIKQLERYLTMVQKATVKVTSAEISDGVYLFILAKLSSYTVGEAGSFDLCVEITDDDASSTATSGSKKFSASLKRPQSAAQMYSLLHQFQMVSIATGVTNVMAIGPFLEDVVYEPIRLGVLEWPVAFELMICYLRMVENDPSRWRLSNVVASSGGMDAKRAEALMLARDLYPTSFFRQPRGEPRDVTDKGKDKKTGEQFYNGTVQGDNPNSKKGCTAWNLGNRHFAKHVDASGCCKFVHACNQYVTDKGPGGQCLGAHKRLDSNGNNVCTYDAAKKCDKPHK